MAHIRVPIYAVYEMFFHYAIVGGATWAGDELYKLGGKKKEMFLFLEKWETGAKAGRNIVRGFET